MVEGYYKKKITISDYVRHDPRTGKMVHVDSYRRNQRYKDYTFSKNGKARKIAKQNPRLKKALDENKDYNPDFDYFFGTSNKKTFSVVDKHDKDDQLGVCLNLYKYDENLIKKLKKLEELGLDVFLDNGSFERFTLMLDQKITPEEYLDEVNCYEFFETITDNYKKLLKRSKKPEDIMITVPEVIGSSKISQKLQKKFLDTYKQFEKDYGCKLIVALQFNANGDDWYEELKVGADFIKDNIPKSWLVGIPFGNDFRVIQNKKNFEKIDNLFDSTLKGREAHLFGCGSPTKLENFAIPNDDFVYSVDASSIMNWSKNSHYFSKGSGRVIDIRYLKGKQGTPETIEKKRKEFEEGSGISYQRWAMSKRMNPKEALSYLQKFDINSENFTSYYHL